MWGWSLAAGVGDAVARRTDAVVVVFAVVVGCAAGDGGGGGGGGVGFGDGERGGVVVEGWLDGVGGWVEVALLGGWVGGLLGWVCRLLGRVCRLLLWRVSRCLRLGLMLLHLWGRGYDGVRSPASATHTTPRDEGGEDGEDDDDDADCDADDSATADAGVGGRVGVR